MKLHDVIQYIISKHQFSIIRIHQLLYYCQSWHLVWEGERLFYNRIMAWNNPIVLWLWKYCEKEYGSGNIGVVKEWKFGDSKNLSQKETTTIDAVLDYYGKMGNQELIDLIHKEDPFRYTKIRKCIKTSLLLDYYSKVRDFAMSK